MGWAGFAREAARPISSMPILAYGSRAHDPAPGEDLHRVLAAAEHAGAAARGAIGAVSRPRHSSEQDEPQYVHHVRADVHEGDAGAQGHYRRDYPVRRSAGLHHSFAVAFG